VVNFLTNKSRKAQVVMEFMIMITLAMIVIIAVASVVYYLSYQYSEEKNIERLTDLGYSLQNELILASEVEYGYERTVEIPDKVGVADYSIGAAANAIVITYREDDLLFLVPNVTGSFSKGTNTIRKTDPNTIIIS